MKARQFCRSDSCVVIGLVSLALLMARGAVAQSALEEIIVTAQKREENLQDVSVSVTALSSKQMRDIGLKYSNDLSQFVPNVEIDRPFGGQTAKIHIRGSGSIDFHSNAQTTIGFYVDEVYLPNIYEHGVAFFDLERVEVLRGPQGTLYGRNATGGAINIITAKPQQEFSGYGLVSYGNFDAARLEGAVTGGITENLASRVAFTYANDDGWMEGRTLFPGTVGGDDFNDTDYYAWRGMLAWNPQDNLEVLLNAHGSQDNSSGFSYQHIGTVDPNTFANTCDGTVRDDCIDFFGYRDPDGIEERGDPTTGDFNLQGPADYETIGGYLRVDWKLEKFTITSITAYDEFQRFHTEDADASPATISHNFYRDKVHGWSQELRLTSTTRGPWDWILGLYYSEDELHSNNLYNFFGFLTFQDYEQDQSSIAGFANVGYQINEQFKVYAGIRYTEDEVEMDHKSDLFDPPPPVGFGTGLSPFDPGSSASPSFDDVIWKVGVDYAPKENWLLYAHVGRGYKSGGVSVGFGDPGEFNIYDPEKLLAYDAGFKSTLFGGKALLNVSGFYYDYRDLQTFDQAAGSFGNFVSVIDNADKAEFVGAEAELRAKPVEALDLLFGLSYLDTEFKEFTRLLTGEDLSGNKNVFSPEWKVTGLARYEWQAPRVLEGKMAASFDWSWVDDVYHGVDNEHADRGKAHWLIGGRLSYFTLGDKLEIALWGQNLSDKKYRTETFDLRSAGLLTSIPNRPRSYGAEIRYSW